MVHKEGSIGKEANVGILHSMLDFKDSRNQRQGSEFFLGKWNS